MYRHHGIGTGFGGGYHEYMGGNVDIDAVTYLMLANEVCQRFGGDGVITIAEGKKIIINYSKRGVKKIFFCKKC